MHPFSHSTNFLMHGSNMHDVQNVKR